ncbi:transcription repressor OFP13-like [Panicum virgatum]|uniref:Transcription repressor n=1 Tax=Panicum virgatum TaxID=38727 RepID=A0A8T0QST3_PANVG|nr:transcription repressor OFP13-like [Panicum virgatum]KAG2576089.1 hypothetical protein PVAP13_6NG004400 [Panicum virgatum]
MVKKKQQLPVGGLTSLFSSSNKQPSHSSSSSMSSFSSSSSSSAWQWASCGLHPRTLSFRQQQQEEEVEEEEDDANGHGCQNQHVDNDSHMALTKQQQAYYCKTINSCFSPNSLASIDSFSSMASSDAAAEAEAVIRAVRSDRLLFEPEEASSFKPIIIKDTTTMTMSKQQAAFGGATAMSVESQNPYRDFRESMEAMVISQGGVRDWCWLEEMLGWYLRANGKSTHELIVGAFVDLLVALSTATSPTDSSSSPATPATDNCSSSTDCSCSCSSL